MSEWISVKVRLPHQKSFIVATKDGRVGEAHLKDDNFFWIEDVDCWVRIFVTHWMPIPEPPKEVE